MAENDKKAIDTKSEETFKADVVIKEEPLIPEYISEFKEGDLVWAKLTGFPLWPGKIVKPPPQLKGLKDSLYVFFLGSEDTSWVPIEDIHHHSNEMLESFNRNNRRNNRKKPRALWNAVKALREITGVPVRKRIKEEPLSPEYIQKNEEVPLKKRNTNARNSNEKKTGTVEKDRTPEDEKNTVLTKPSALENECGSHSEEKNKFQEENDPKAIVDLSVESEASVHDGMQKKEKRNSIMAENGKKAMDTKSEETFKADVVREEPLIPEYIQENEEVIVLSEKNKTNARKCASVENKTTSMNTKLKQKNLKVQCDVSVKTESLSSEDMQKMQTSTKQSALENECESKSEEKNELQEENDLKGIVDLSVESEASVHDASNSEDMQKKQIFNVPLRIRKTNARKCATVENKKTSMKPKSKFLLKNKRKQLGKHTLVENKKFGEMENNGKSFREMEVKGTCEGRGNVNTFPKKNVLKSASKKKHSNIPLLSVNKNLEQNKKIKNQTLTKKKCSVARPKTDLEPRTLRKLRRIVTSGKKTDDYADSCYRKLFMQESPEAIASGSGINSTEEKALNEDESNNPDEPSKLQIGFICLDETGKKFAKKLLEAGHEVTIWNGFKHSNLCDLGVKPVKHPADLIVNCDITFSYARDPDTCLEIVFGEDGILKGFKLAEKPVKGYIEMGVTDPEIAERIGDAIVKEQGRFLEAPIVGTTQDIENGTFTILVAGHPMLYKEVFDILQLFGKKAFYVKYLFGYACRMGLFASALPGTICAALAEAVVLTERLELPKEDFLECLKNGPLGCKFIVDKANIMFGCEWIRALQSGTPLKIMREIMELALEAGTKSDTPTPMMAAANEVYKRAKFGTSSEEDISIAYKVAKCKI